MQGPDHTTGLQSGSGAPSTYSQRYSIQELGHNGQKYMDQGQLISREESLSPRGYPIPSRSSQYPHTLIHGQTSDESSTPAESENPIGLNLTPGQGQLVKKSGTGASSRGEGSMGSRTQYHAPLEPEVIARLDELFFKFLQRLCSDLNACDSKGDQIHQPLMAKKMQRLEASTDFRPFKFRIQAFTNAFHESLVQHGLTEDILPLRKVKVYLWKHKYISRFNEDGKKQKSKGNHVWNIEARRVIDPHVSPLPPNAASSMSMSTSTAALTTTTVIGGGAGSSSKTTTVEGSIGSSNPPVRWEFRGYSGRIAGQIIKFARVGVPYIYSPRIWDAQIPCPKAEFSSPWLPSWLKWHKGDLRGIPGPNDESCSIIVIAEYVREGEPCRLEMEFPLTVSDPLKEGELMDMPNEDEGDEQEFEDDDSSNGEDDEEDEAGVGGGSGELRLQESAEARGRGGRRKQPSERRTLARAKARQGSKRRKQSKE
ncbi:hypothetical protein BG011_000674 [Mortierella polycephala]|uniref:Uncharacterized protein n=1 Tax=Mortierella polycephala TaxID=41804 RepID=A0A9P6U6U4_9FUNG|nr:hypothetical protein BG011_000674 [Mortierella polycephala]